MQLPKDCILVCIRCIFCTEYEKDTYTDWSLMKAIIFTASSMALLTETDVVTVQVGNKDKYTVYISVIWYHRIILAKAPPLLLHH